MKLQELFEGRGAQILRFADYLETGAVAEKYQSDFARLGAELFELGFNFMATGPTLQTPQTPPTFSRKIMGGPGAGGAQSVTLPIVVLGGYKAPRTTSRAERVDITFADFTKMQFQQDAYNIWDVHSIGLEFLLDKSIELAGAGRL